MKLECEFLLKKYINDNNYKYSLNGALALPNMYLPMVGYPQMTVFQFTR